jgi:hypothetical protein
MISETKRSVPVLKEPNNIGSYYLKGCNESYEVVEVGGIFDIDRVENAGLRLEVCEWLFMFYGDISYSLAN